MSPGMYVLWPNQLWREWRHAIGMVSTSVIAKQIVSSLSSQGRAKRRHMVRSRDLRLVFELKTPIEWGAGGHLLVCLGHTQTSH